jgi:DNA-binding NarL/FixJ family response regulator
MRILIADDHALFRESLHNLLTVHGIEVIGEAQDGQAAVEQARRLQPDVVLMDLGMPGVDGLAATRLISAEMPQVKVVVLTASDDDAKLFEAIKSGAQGYLLKNLESREFFSLLEGIGRGEPALTPVLARKLLQEFAHPTRPALSRDPDALTDRERNVLALLVEGVTSNRKLAKRLGLSENTVKFHVRNILDKLHLHNRAQVVGFALRHGMVPSAENPASGER